jgi:hypothetical protein
VATADSAAAELNRARHVIPYPLARILGYLRVSHAACSDALTQANSIKLRPVVNDRDRLDSSTGEVVVRATCGQLRDARDSSSRR